MGSDKKQQPADAGQERPAGNVHLIVPQAIRERDRRRQPLQVESPFTEDDDDPPPTAA